MFTKLFWKDVAERLIFTLAQVASGLIAADGLTSLSVNWQAWLVTLTTAGLGVILKSIIAAKAVNDSMSPASLVTGRPDDLP